MLSLKSLVYQGIISGSLIILVLGIVVVQCIRIFKITTQDLWEVVMGIISGTIIIISGMGFLKSMSLYKKLENNLRDSITSSQNLVITETTPLLTPVLDPKIFFYLPLLTVLREGMESILLISGVTINIPPESIPLSIVLGITTGTSISYALHKLTDKLQLKSLFMMGGFVMVLMGVGILSRSIGKYEDMKWGLTIGLDPDAVDTFDPRTVVWYIKDFNENTNLWAGVANSLVGYRHVATKATIGVYCGAWAIVALVLGLMKYKGSRKSTLGIDIEEGDLLLTGGSGHEELGE